jgi:hypothetical protein
VRSGVAFLLAAVTSAFVVAAAVAADTDRGRERPPAQLTEENKSVWMSEWVACRHLRMSALAKEIGIKITSGRPPQVAAVLIARKAEAPLYEIGDALDAAVDGCRNGILWRFYHETPSRA